MKKFTLLAVAPLFAYSLGVYTHSSGNYYEDLWSLRISDGLLQTKLVDYSTHSNNAVSRPRFSPNYSKVCFIHYPGTGFGATQLCVVNANGTGLIVLDTNGTIKDGIQWHPNGQQILYQLGNSTYRIDANGSNKTFITNIFVVTYGFGYNYDGSLIGYSAGGGLYVSNPDGSNLVNITGPDAYSQSGDYGVLWSRNSNVIFYGNGGSTIQRKINSDGTGDTQIGTRTGFFGRYSISSDNTKIFYTDRYVSAWELWQMPVSGSGASAVVPTRHPWRNTNFPHSIAGNRLFIIDNTNLELISILEDGSDYRLDVPALLGPPISTNVSF